MRRSILFKEGLLKSILYYLEEESHQVSTCHSSSIMETETIKTLIDMEINRLHIRTMIDSMNSINKLTIIKKRQLIIQDKTKITYLIIITISIIIVVKDKF